MTAGNEAQCGEFRCVAQATGALQWAVTNVTRIGRFAQAQVTLNTDTDTFYITNELGELIAAQASPVEVIRNPAAPKSPAGLLSHPALCGAAHLHAR